MTHLGVALLFINNLQCVISLYTLVDKSAPGSKDVGEESLTRENVSSKLNLVSGGRRLPPLNLDNGSAGRGPVSCVTPLGTSAAGADSVGGMPASQNQTSILQYMRTSSR